MVAHLGGGGSTPDASACAIVLVVVAAVHRLVLAARERSGPILFSSLGLAQAAAHTLFGLLMHGSEPAADPMTVEMSHRMAMPAPGTALAPSGPGLSMVLGHVLAALVLGWFARNGERCLWAAARRSVERWVPVGAWRSSWQRVTALVGFTPTMPPRRLRWGPAPAPDPRAHRYRATGGRVWRGPPSGCLLPG